MNTQELKNIIEAAVLSSGEPLSMDRLLGLFDEEARPAKEQVLECIEALRAECAERGIELVEVASGYRYQARRAMAPWISRLWEEKPPRYSRAYLETLALIAYRQPITRAEIEDIRGVAVTTNIIKSLTERGWVRVVGHRDVPGKPAMYATTRQFLDYFNLQGLGDLPTLAELRDMDKLNEELVFDEVAGAPAEAGGGVGLRIPAPDLEPFAL
jgi:segregation and condensation protein B